MAMPWARGIMVGGGAEHCVYYMCVSSNIFVHMCVCLLGLIHDKVKGFNEAYRGSATEGGPGTRPVILCKCI